jgi:hypothetical protein
MEQRNKTKEQKQRTEVDIVIYYLLQVELVRPAHVLVVELEREQGAGNISFSCVIRKYNLI